MKSAIILIINSAANDLDNSLFAPLRFFCETWHQWTVMSITFNMNMSDMRSIVIWIIIFLVSPVKSVRLTNQHRWLWVKLSTWYNFIWPLLFNLNFLIHHICWTWHFDARQPSKTPHLFGLTFHFASAMLTLVALVSAVVLLLPVTLADTQWGSGKVGKLVGVSPTTVISSLGWSNCFSRCRLNSTCAALQFNVSSTMVVLKTNKISIAVFHRKRSMHHGFEIF